MPFIPFDPLRLNEFDDYGLLKLNLPRLSQYPAYNSFVAAAERYRQTVPNTEAEKLRRQVQTLLNEAVNKINESLSLPDCRFLINCFANVPGKMVASH